MSKEHLERFMTQVAESKDLQAKVGEEITGDALVALGAAHGCEFSIEDVQGGAELSDEQLGGVAGGMMPLPSPGPARGAVSTLRLRRGSKGRFSNGVLDAESPMS